MPNQPALSWLHPSPPAERIRGAPGETQLREFGRRLRTLRQSRRLSQVELGRPYSSAYISLLEQGGIVPTDRALRTIADRLGISPVELLRDAR